MQNIIKYKFKINKIIKNITKSNIKINILKSKNMRYINYRFRNKYYETDIISFDRPIKEILINIKEFKKDNINIAIHGLLHILGYCHNKKYDKMIMRELEIIIGMSGIEPPPSTMSKWCSTIEPHAF
jgi:ssRNA-specific RNase YbeY (16S rRNA maturation enzyme)